MKKKKPKINVSQNGTGKKGCHLYLNVEIRNFIFDTFYLHIL